MGDSLENISPIDGRYNAVTRPLVPFFSEKALINYRMLVEGEYLKFLSSYDELDVRKFSDEEISIIDKLINKISVEDASSVKEIEKTTNHDVKAVEYFMKEKLKGTSLNDVLPWIHFGLTSYDTNNIALNLMIRDATEVVMLPKLKEIRNTIEELAIKYANQPMLARTHGQPASPTTFGKEMKVFSERLFKQIDKIEDSYLEIKLNGATGNYNAHVAAYSNIDWLNFTEDFTGIINDLNPDGKEPKNPILIVTNPVTTQIEPNDSLVAFFNIYKSINNILVDFNRDMWQYISDNWIVQKPKEGEIGSSTMPHKVNPIDFENSEGNAYMSNGIFQIFVDKMQISRLQRDLVGSTIERNYGVAFSHSLIAYNSVLKGLKKISINETEMIAALNRHPEVVSEGIQTILRREGIDSAYEKLKDLTRGKVITMDAIHTFVNGLDVSDKVKEELNHLTPTTYTGIASEIIHRVKDNYFD